MGGPCAFDSGGHVTFAMKLVELVCLFGYFIALGMTTTNLSSYKKERVIKTIRFLQRLQIAVI